jgi:hypothetical protein
VTPPDDARPVPGYPGVYYTDSVPLTDWSPIILLVVLELCVLALVLMC